jgi:hypothetical protein
MGKHGLSLGLACYAVLLAGGSWASGLGAAVTRSTLGAVLGAAAEGQVVFRADFDAQGADRPPAGWTMWGAEAYKDPANYTRDTTNPHTGNACFRLHHPADTAGYIVSAPDQAVRPRRGMRYEVSFWARTDKPGPAPFYWTAYESLAPFVDGPSAGHWALDLGTEWREFAFTIREGWDFFADASRYLMLTFHATEDRAQERTLWLDDVTVRELPGDRQGRLVDERSLKHEPLQHRLRPGDQLKLDLDATKTLGPPAKQVGGISFHRVCGWTGEPYDREGKYTLHPAVEAAIRDLRLPMTRFYAVGDEPFGLEAALDRVAELVGKVGVPREWTVVELETQGADRKLAPAVWAQALRYCRAKGYGFRFWEVCNEPYLGVPSIIFRTPQDYVSHFREVSAALHAVDPKVQVGLALGSDTPWRSPVLKECAGLYDFVVGHYYAVSDVDRRKFEVVTLSENYRKLDEILRTNALIRAYNPGRKVYQLDTEWGMISSGPQGEDADYVDRNANIFGVLHRAVRLIYYAREGMLRGASSWQMLNRLNAQGFGIVTQEAPEKRFMLYWLYWFFNRHLGDQLLQLAGTAPYYSPAAGDDSSLKAGEYAGPQTPVLATVSADRKTLYLMIANGSWDQRTPCAVTLQHFAARGAEAVLLSSSDPNAKPLLERREDFVQDLPVRVSAASLACTLPPHSVAFITLHAR